MATNRTEKRFFSPLGAMLAAVSLVYSPLTMADCLETESLKALDYDYEQALRMGDKPFLSALLAADFVWIHNHGVQVETRAELLARFGDGYKPTKSREQADVQVRRLEDTAVIHGATTVQEIKSDGLHANTYQFLRTYVATDEGCKLLAGQTMKTWSSTDSAR